MEELMLPCRPPISPTLGHYIFKLNYRIFSKRPGSHTNSTLNLGRPSVACTFVILKFCQRMALISGGIKWKLALDIKMGECLGSGLLGLQRAQESPGSLAEMQTLRQQACGGPAILHF